jgi:hypothetical protein
VAHGAAPPAEVTNKPTVHRQLLSVFDINAGRDNASSSAEGISSNFYAIRTPLGQTRPNDFKDSLGNWIQAPPDTGLQRP